MRYIHYFFGFFCLIPFSSIADVHIEPYGGVGGAFSTSIDSPQSFFMKYTVGGRLGYKLSIVHAGLDIFWTHYDTGDHRDVTTVRPFPIERKGLEQATGSVDITPAKPRTSFQPLSIGAFTAIKLPLFFNVYGSIFYAFGSKDNIGHQGYGLKAGVSWLSASYFQLNLSAKWAYYTCQSKAKECANSFSIGSALLSVSVPFSLDLFSSSNSSSESVEEEPEEENISSATAV